jgi:hypothetical protein
MAIMGIDYSTVSIGRKRTREKAGGGKSNLSNLMKEVEDKISKIKI